MPHSGAATICMKHNANIVTNRQLDQPEFVFLSAGENPDSKMGELSMVAPQPPLCEKTR